MGGGAGESYQWNRKVRYLGGGGVGAGVFRTLNYLPTGACQLPVAGQLHVANTHQMVGEPAVVSLAL
jgi:hypothetical protein